MNTNEYDNQVQQSVIAIAKTDDEFRAVELQEQNGTTKILWTKSSTADDKNWQAFAAECGISIGSIDQREFDDDNDKIVVVGFNSAGVAFYRVKMPAVEEKEIEAIVKLQAESRLPLPVEQMELAWRTSPARDGQINITMAAARKFNAQVFLDKVKSIQPAQILLDCEGIVKAWKIFFSENKQNAVIINSGTRNTQVCLIEDGQLSNSVALDMGIDDFAEGQVEDATEVTELFVQDMRSVIDLFDHERSAELPVFVLSDGSATYVSLVSALRLAGINAKLTSPDPAKLTTKKKLNVEDMYKYRTALGLALMALDNDSEKLNLFEHLYSPAGEEKSKHWLYTPKVVYTITAVMLLLFVVVLYGVDTAKPGAIEKRIKASGAEADINLLMERQKLKKRVAQQRPDILDLINEITACGQNNQRSQGSGRSGRGQGSGIQLESFHFKKGQRVTITGTASNNDQLYSFEKSLEENKDISEVGRSATQNTIGANITSSTRGASSNRGNRSRWIKFTITFHYKNFTQ